jgi:Protein of unknown function (DUF3800)
LTQYHNLDDSGDPGPGVAAGSSTHFALAMVQLAERAPLPELATVRSAFHLPPMFEFKYHKTTPAQREGFLNAIQKIPFRVRAVVVDKSGLPEPYSLMRGEDLRVEFIVRLILRAQVPDLANDVLIIDGVTPRLCREVRVRLSEECRREKRVRPFSKIIGSRSKTEDGLQLADMIAGATRHYVMNVEPTYFDSFARKVIDLWQVPPGGK